MPIYEVKGLDSKGKTVGRVIDADNERAARTRLKREGIFATSLKIKSGDAPKPRTRTSRKDKTEEEPEKKGLSLSREVDIDKYLERITTGDIANVTRMLATLIGAGIPLVGALAAVVEQTEKEKLKVALSTIRERVNEGTTLAEAMKDYPKYFSDLFINMVRAGEQSGALELVLEQLAEYTEKQDELKSEIQGALFYPLILGGLSVLIVVFLMTFVVPRIAEIFNDFDAALPLITRVVLGISALLTNMWFWVLTVIVLAASIFFLVRWLRTAKGQKQKDTWLLKVPVFGKLLLLSSISRFAGTMATLLSAGVPLLRSLDIVKEILGNVVLSEAVNTARENVSEGQSLARPLKQSGRFPPLLISMIETGERTGSLEPMLRRVAVAYEKDVQRTIASMVRLIEPIMILVMGGIALSIALSIMIPLLQMNKMIS